MNKTDKLIMTPEQLSAVNSVLQVLKRVYNVEIDNIYSVKKKYELDHDHVGEHLCDKVDYFPISISSNDDVGRYMSFNDTEPDRVVKFKFNIEVHENFYATLLQAYSDSTRLGEASLENFVREYFLPLDVIGRNNIKLRQILSIELFGRLGLNDRVRNMNGESNASYRSESNREERIAFIADLAAQYFLINNVFCNKPVILSDFIPQLYSMLPMLLSFDTDVNKRLVDILTQPAVDCGSITARPLAYAMYNRCCNGRASTMGVAMTATPLALAVNRVGVMSRQAILRMANTIAKEEGSIMESVLSGTKDINILSLRKRYDLALVSKDSMINDAAKSDLIDELYSILNRINLYLENSKVTSKDKNKLESLENDINLSLEEVRDINVKKRRYTVNLTQEIPKDYRG